MSLSSSLQRVLELQEHYSAGANPEMQERNNIVKDLGVIKLRELLTAENDFDRLRVNGSGGVGANATVPWIRIADPAKSLSAQSGWYLVFLFAGDGSSVVLTLNQGVTGLNASKIARSVAASRQILAQNQFSQTSTSSKSTESFDLKAPTNKWAKLYQAGNIEAFTYNRGEIPEDHLLLQDIRYLLERLAALPNISDAIVEPQSDHMQEWDEIDSVVKKAYWGREKIASVLSSLTDQSPQIILQGPPGTGKTFVAKEIASCLLRQMVDGDVNQFIEIVQFHPSYGYEDFVEGLKPVARPDGGLEFTKVPGPIVRMTNLIQQDGNPRVLIIDEMNRANLPRVFGELMYLLEYRDQYVNLMYQEEFALPSNLFIIGTMNTADKSIKGIDLALRRRFDFFEVPPSVDVLRGFYSIRTNQLGDSLFDGFVDLNREVSADMGDRHHGIGHSFFMKDSFSRADLVKIWELQLAPLLEDYFYDRPHLAEKYSLEKFWPIG